MYKILITGGAGYVGAMLAKNFSEKEEVEEILCLDKESKPDILEGNKKIKWLSANTFESEKWFSEAEKFNPDIVIHCAWQIREMYGKKEKQWQWNILGSDNVFDFALKHSSVKKLIHFSTVASYSARKENTFDHRFKESEPFRESDYLYAIEKKVAEEHLKEKFEKSENKNEKIVFVIRPAAITGPRGRFMRVRFGLQSALSGQLKGGFVYSFVSLLTKFVPATKKWARQFIHEDDISGIVELLSFKEVSSGTFEIFNACPPGEIVLAKDMAQIVGKKTITLHPFIVRFAFFILWHATRGRIPTSKGGWKSYSYPIIVDGSKITEKFNYQYKYNSKDAFSRVEGKYAKYIKKD